MPSKVYSGAVVGVEAYEVEIEVHAGWGNADKIAVVGLPDAAVRESKDRVPLPEETVQKVLSLNRHDGIGARRIAKSTGFPLGTVNPILTRSRQRTC
jgi:hypothetical protein